MTPPADCGWSPPAGYMDAMTYSNIGVLGGGVPGLAFSVGPAADVMPWILLGLVGCTVVLVVARRRRT